PRHRLEGSQRSAQNRRKLVRASLIGGRRNRRYLYRGHAKLSRRHGELPERKGCRLSGQRGHALSKAAPMCLTLALAVGRRRESQPAACPLSRRHTGGGVAPFVPIRNAFSRPPNRSISARWSALARRSAAAGSTMRRSWPRIAATMSAQAGSPARLTRSSG